MGAASFCKSITAKTASEGFDYLVEEAEHEYGHDSYNGTISTCTLGRCRKQFDKLTKTSLKETEKLVDKYLNNNSKCIADYINCGLERMVLVTVENKRGQYKKPVYKEQYCLYVGKDKFPYDERLLDTKDTLKEAKEYAGKYALKEGRQVTIRKERTLVKGETTVAEVVIKRRVIKTIPKTLKPNQKIEKYYKFVYFGWASC